MKCICFIVCIVLISACGSKKEKSGEEYVTNDTGSEKLPAVDAIARGEALIKSSDCTTCHHKTSTIIGPAHLEVAKKYEFTEASVKLLADKIIKGGVGVWGQIPMIAHTDVKQEDAEAMARYILSLDDEKEH